MAVPSPADCRRVQKLSALVEAAQQARCALSITRLRVVEKLCEPPETAQHFAVFLARRALAWFDADPPLHLDEQTRLRHRRLMEEALGLMEASSALAPDMTTALRAHARRLESEQNEHKDIPYGAVRLINDRRLLQVEEAIRCFTRDRPGSPYWAYHATRSFAEAYEPSAGTGLIPRSVPALQEVLQFWRAFYGLDEPKG